MRIGIDARFYGSLGKGLGRYTQKLIQQLEQLDSRNEYVVFLRRENFEDYSPNGKNFSKVMVDCPWYTFKEQWEMPRILNKYNLDLVHFPHFNVPIFYRRPFVVTIHDLILLHFPTIRGTTLPRVVYWMKYRLYTLIIRHAIKKSQRILTVSKFTKQDILKHYPIEKRKIIVTYESCENFCRFGPLTDGEILKKHGIIKPYIMYVGNAYPHKNLERLVRAFGVISQTHPELKLVLVGKEDFFYQRIRQYVEAEQIANVRFVGFVTDEELDVLYKNSWLYVFPSLYEGFGLPPLEAMAKGAVVAASDHPALQEILGTSAIWFHGEKIESIAMAIERGITDEALRQQKQLAGYQKIGEYSWRKMAEQTLEVYQQTQQS